VTGVQMLAGLVSLGGLVWVVNLIGCELERECESFLGSDDCAVWSCTEAGEWTEPDGSRRCMGHVGVAQ
jgi:hypothetical protein